MNFHVWCDVDRVFWIKVSFTITLNLDREKKEIDFK